MKDHFESKLMTLCDVGTLYMYNDVRNTFGFYNFYKTNHSVSLGNVIIPIDKNLYQNNNICFHFDRNIQQTETIFFDHFKSDAFSPLGLCYVYCALLQITKDETKLKLLKIIEDFGFNVDDSFCKNMEDYIRSLGGDGVELECYNSLSDKDSLQVDEFYEKWKEIFNFEDILFDYRNQEKTIEEVMSEIFNRSKQMFSDFYKHRIVVRLVLINNVRISGRWLCKFNTEDTKIKDFYVKNKIIQVPMIATIDEFSYLYTNGLQFISMNLLDKINSLCFVIILPDKDDYLNDQLHLSFKKEFELLVNKKCPSSVLDLEIPKFKIETECNLNKVFYKFLQSNFMDEYLELDHEFCSHRNTKVVLKHKAVIELNEVGICKEETSCSRRYTYNDRYNKNVHHKFHCNRPFVFYLFDTKPPSIKCAEDSIPIIYPLMVGRYTGE
ncbi:serpin-type proteinase inhibitor 4 [Vairimorpha necatrix]|uniref:Serpin-type proteinase inhibitor 4 n=1 Tax=Vairimorpha necatrix TaxID=6039 RepID=A0AAX4JG81_9MICR